MTKLQKKHPEKHLGRKTGSPHAFGIQIPRLFLQKGEIYLPLYPEQDIFLWNQTPIYMLIEKISLLIFSA
jgi:hypothetical protein